MATHAGRSPPAEERRLSIASFGTSPGLAAGLAALQHAGTLGDGVAAEHACVAPLGAAGAYRFRVASFRVGSGRCISGATASILHGAKLDAAMHAGTADAQLWLCWAVNYVAAARALGVASSRAGALAADLIGYDEDQRALLGHATLPVVASMARDESRVFIAPTPLPAACDPAARWAAIVEPLVRDGWLHMRDDGGNGGGALRASTSRARTSRRTSAGGGAAVPPLGLLPAPVNDGAPHFYLAVAADAGGDGGPFIRARAPLRAVARELAALSLGCPMSAALVVHARYMLLGLTRLARSPLSPRDVPAAQPFVLFPSRVSWAQAAGAAAWGRDLEAALRVRSVVAGGRGRPTGSSVSARRGVRCC